MSSLRRGGTPLTGAIPSLEASNQAQIDDLVQRNRTLEHTNKKLSEQVAQEAARAKDAVLEIQRQWDLNQLQWKEGCEEILLSYRIVQKKIEVELERERSAVIREMTITREEKLQRLQRDYKIKLFQMKEEELERKVEDMEEERTYLAEEYEAALRREGEKNAEYAAKLKDTRETLAKSTREKNDKEAKYTKLIAEHSNLKASFGTLDSKCLRTQLQLESAQTKITDLERTNDELKRSNGDLARQLDRWANLETKGGEAAEKQHKKNIALELELGELKETYETQRDQDARALEKLVKKLEKHQAAASTFETESKEQAKLAQEANKKLAKLQKQVDKLKAELEEERARVRPLSPQKAKTSSPPIVVEDEIEISDNDEPAPKEKYKPKQPATTAKAGPSTYASKSTKLKLTSQTARKTTGGKPPSRSRKPVEEQEASLSEGEDEPAQAKKPRSKAKNVEEIADDEPPPRKRAGKAKAVEEDDNDIEDIKEIVAPRKRAAKRKPGETRSDGEVEIVEKPKKKTAQAGSETRDAAAPAKKPAPKRKEGSRAPSKQPTTARAGAEDDEGDNDVAPKKKKRRMIFPTVQPPGPFAFESLTQFDNGGLDIPSILSPLKPEVLVPQRSTSTAFGSRR